MPSQPAKPRRRFPPPWRVVEVAAAFVVEDAAQTRLAYVYFDTRPEGSPNAQALSRDQARRIAINLARLPELLTTGR